MKATSIAVLYTYMSTLPYTLRQGVPGDETTLALVGGASFLEAFAGVLDSADILAHCAKHHTSAGYTKYLDHPTARAYLAEVQPGSAAVGYIVTCEPDLPVADPSPLDYELRRIYLLHRFHGTGIGRALMDQAVTTTRELGRTRLLLGVYGKNHAAIEFYRKAGFEQIGERYFQVGKSTHHDAVMARIVV